MSVIPYTNAVVTVLRRPPLDPATGRTGAPAPVLALTNIPVYIIDFVAQLQTKGISASFSVKMLYDGQYAIWDGDMLTGYNPTAMIRTPTLTIQHVDPSGPAGKNIRSALVTVQG